MVRVHVFYSEEDGGFIANAVDLTFLSAFGYTLEEAIEEFDVLWELYKGE
jgi:predicted RNase H-like HicB family nuclease